MCQPAGLHASSRRPAANGDMYGYAREVDHTLKSMRSCAALGSRSSIAATHVIYCAMCAHRHKARVRYPHLSMKGSDDKIDPPPGAESIDIASPCVH